MFEDCGSFYERVERQSLYASVHDAVGFAESFTHRDTVSIATSARYDLIITKYILFGFSIERGFPSDSNICVTIVP
jgi:hypothetical protein